MPRPVPPPPPQASAEETAAAVRLVRILAAAFIALFLLISLQYHPRGWAVEYGRSNGTSWNLFKLDRLRVSALRGEAGDRKVAWLVGSSILRDSFDEALINDALASRGSEWRVAKFGQTRGASGLSWGMLRRLPVAPGDVVVHNVAMENFRAEWLEFTDLPGWRVGLMLKPSELLAVDEWSWQTRLEEASAAPGDFYGFHEDHMQGVERWLKLPFTGEWPRKRRHSMHIKYRRAPSVSTLDSARSKGERSPYFLDAARVDLSERQFNMVGIDRMRAWCAAQGLTLWLVDVPPRQEYAVTFMTDEVRAMWDGWRAAQPDLAYFPQADEDTYYDMKHPDTEGRAMLSEYLVDWLHEPVRGAPTQARWPL